MACINNPALVNAIVCARNESYKTFVPVIKALRKTRGIGKIIFVNDGNNAGVRKLLRYRQVKIIQGPQQGKGEAMTEGLKCVSTDRVLFVDSDIEGLTPKHVAELLSHKSDYTVGLRDNHSCWLGPVPPISGERILPTQLARSVELKGYEAETALNAIAGNSGISVSTFTMKGCVNPTKNPFKRTVQVLVAAGKRPVYLAQYSAGWSVTKVREKIMPILTKANKAIEDTKNGINAAVVIGIVALTVGIIALAVAVRR